MATVGPFLNEYMSNRYGRSHSLPVFLRYKHCSVGEFLSKKRCRFKAFLMQRKEVPRVHLRVYAVRSICAVQKV